MNESASAPKTCPKCGTALPSAATAGLCPRCLMAEAMHGTQTEAAPATPQTALSPAELAPHFPQLEVLECLGRGGMGVVYKARQKTLNRLVALKLLAPERVTDVGFAERFTREAQALAALNHPNIVTIYDFGVTTPPQTPDPKPQTPFYFLLMEFVDGVNLRQAMKAGRFTPEQALAVVPPVCEALQYAHEHGIVHRDIKPENLLLDKDGRVKIADFGIAKMLTADGARLWSQTQPQPMEQAKNAAAGPADTAALRESTLATAVGTPRYMAPEQRDHQRTDHRADIYSLGVVLYELLTGEMPADKLQPPSRKVQIDVRLDEIVLRALETKPELRFQTAGEFRTQVETFVEAPAARACPANSEFISSWGFRLTPGPAIKTDYIRALESLFGSVTSDGAIRTLNLSRVGFIGILTVAALLPGARWWWPAFGFLGMFALIGAGYLSEAAARRGVDLTGVCGVPGGNSPVAVWRRRIFWLIVVGGIVPMVFFAASLALSLGRGGEKVLEAASTEQMAVIFAKVFGVASGLALLSWAMLQACWRTSPGETNPWPRNRAALVALVMLWPLLLLTAPFVIWEFVATTRPPFAGMNAAEWATLAVLVLLFVQGAIWVTRNLRQTLHEMDGASASPAPVAPQTNDRHSGGQRQTEFSLKWTGAVLVLVAGCGLFGPAEFRGHAFVAFFGIASIGFFQLLTWFAQRQIDPRPSDPPSTQAEPRWQGWDVWVIGLCMTAFGALWLYRLSVERLYLSLRPGAVASEVVLPTAVATVILLVGAAFLWMLAKNLKSAPASAAVTWKRQLGRAIVPAIAVAMLVRTFVAQPFWAVTDAIAPEIPRGSLVLVWQPTRTFAAGEIIAYIEKGRVNLGRVDKPGQGAVFVKRNDSEPTSVLHSDIVGKVLSVLWRGSAQPSSAQPSPTIQRVEITGDKAVVHQAHFDGSGLLFTFGTGTNRWTPSGRYLDSLFNVTLEWPWLGKGAQWVIKPRHGIHTNYRLDGPPGPMLGKLIFHPGSVRPDAEGLCVIGEFHPEKGEALPLAVHLVADKPLPPRPPSPSSVTTPAPVKTVDWSVPIIGIGLFGVLGIGFVVLLVWLVRKGGTAGKVAAVFCIVLVLLLAVGLAGFLSRRARRESDLVQRAMAAATETKEAKAEHLSPMSPTPQPALPSYQEFDQTPGQGWRALADTGKFTEAAELIRDYLRRTPTMPERHRANLSFHAAQCLAFDGQPQSIEQALVHLSSARGLPEPADFPIRWNDYVAATEAFLKRDLPALQAARARIAAGPKLEGGPANLDVVDRLIAHFGKSYTEAYRGKELPGAKPTAPAPPGALFSAEQPVVLPGDATVRVRLLMADKDGKKQPLDEEIIFKTAKDRATGFVLRWHAYGDKHPQQANDVLVHLVDPDTGVILHSMEGGFGSGLRLTSPDHLPLPAQNKSHLLARPGVHTSFNLIRAETPAAPGAPITDWRDLHAEVTLINPANERPVPAFQMPALAPRTAPPAKAGPAAAPLIRREVKQANPGGKDLVMTFEELSRDAKTSTATVKHVSGASVPSAMFIARGAYDIAKARGAAYFINLKEWEAEGGTRMYLIGFAPDKNVDPKTYFDLNEPLPADKRQQFLPVSLYDRIFKDQP